MIIICWSIFHVCLAFSTPWFLFSNPSNHHLVFFLLEMFNNIIQYQFDGNSNLVYTIIRKRQVFHSLANLPTVIYFIKNFTLNTDHESFSRIVAQLTKHWLREAKNNSLISRYQRYQDNLQWYHQDLLVQLNIPRSCQIHNHLHPLKLPIIKQLQPRNRVVWNWVSWRYCFLVVT